MDYLIDTHQLEPQAIISIRDRRRMDELPRFIQAAIPELFGRLGSLQITPSGPPFVIYHEFGAQDIDAEVSLPIGEPVDPDGTIESRVLPAMTVARTLHVGPYETLGDAYSALRNWITSRGFEIAGPVQERYLNGPGDTVASREYQTEIEMPVIPAVVAGRI